MKLILFGATGMVGAGALREALADAEVEAVLSVGRRSTGLTAGKSSGVSHPKLREPLIPDLFDLGAFEAQAKAMGEDTHATACIWALGVSSVGLDEAAYARVTEELTLLWARALLALNPGISFCYCSAMGAGGKSMWARVRRRVEAGLKELPFKHVGCVRPGMIRPGRGISHRFLSYRIALVLLWPVFPLLVWLTPWLCTTSARLGRTMLRVVQGRADPSTGSGQASCILESRDINRIGR